MKTVLRKGSFWFTLFLAVLMLAFIIDSFNYSAKARLVPLIISVPSFIGLIFILIAEKYPRVISIFDVYEKVKKPSVAAEENTEVVPENKIENKKIWKIFGWMVILFVSLIFLGFYITTPLYVLAFLKFQARSGWLRAAIIAIVAGAIMYFAFGTMMKVDMFRGILFGERLPPI